MRWRPRGMRMCRHVCRGEDEVGDGRLKCVRRTLFATLRTNRNAARYVFSCLARPHFAPLDRRAISRSSRYFATCVLVADISMCHGASRPQAAAAFQESKQGQADLTLWFFDFGSAPPP